MNFTEQQIENLAPNPAAFIAGKSLSGKQNWLTFAKSERSLWGEIKGSGKNPYQTQIDTTNFSYKCSCPSRQFPCKHGIGLMLLFTNWATEFSLSDEPDWVKMWLDKREAKVNKVEKKEDLTQEQIEKREKAKVKTLANRFEDVTLGVEELELWLKDLVRVGILDFPNKSETEFNRVATRMVDAKAPGLANWVREFNTINYSKEGVWQQETLALISKLFLLLSTFKNYENLEPTWQTTIKNLVGWSQSAKELLESTDVNIVDDYWLITGQENTTEGDISTQKNWLVGLNTHKKAIIVNHATRFAPIENPVIPGSVVQATLLYFENVLPYRAVFKTNSLNTSILKLPAFSQNFQDVYSQFFQIVKINPWQADLLCLVKNVTLLKVKDEWLIYDEDLNYCEVEETIDTLKLLNWLALTKNEKTDAALVYRKDKLLPLGIFHNNKYLLL